MSQLFLRNVILSAASTTEQRTFKNLRVSFRIEKSLESIPNSATIEVYNLSPQSREFLEKKPTIALLVGYGEVPRLLFTGNLPRVVTIKNGPDAVTTLEAGDGLTTYQLARFNTSFSPGAKTRTIIENIISSMGLAKGSIRGLSEGQYVNGFSFSGLARDAMDLLMGKEGLEWSIQDGAVQILATKDTTNQTAVLLTKETGLIGSPKKKAKGQGVEAVSLLNTELKPGRKVQLVSKFLQGTFKVAKVIHKGDTFGKEFFSEMELR